MFCYQLCGMLQKIIFQPGSTYHVYNRSNGSEPMFRHAANYNHFLRKYNEYMSGLWDTHAYCLMPTHFHFLITVKPNTKIESEMSLRCSQAFSNLANSYTQSFNKLHKRHGSLFTQNFRRKPVYDNEYLKTVICYIHNNPVKDGIAQVASDWQFSSYNELRMRNETLFGLHPVISLFGSRESFIEHHLMNETPENFRIVYKKAG